MNAKRQLFLLYSKQLMFVCQRYLATDEECTTALTDIFLRIYDALEKYEYHDEKSLYKWVRTIAANYCINVLKQKRRMFKNAIISTYKEEEDNHIYEGLHDDYTQEELMKCLRNTPDRLRLVFNMYAIEELSIKEIAARLETKTNTIKVYITRARHRLEKELLEIKKTREKKQ